MVKLNKKQKNKLLIHGIHVYKTKYERKLKVKIDETYVFNRDKTIGRVMDPKNI